MDELFLILQNSQEFENRNLELYCQSAFHSGVRSPLMHTVITTSQQRVLLVARLEARDCLLSVAVGGYAWMRANETQSTGMEGCTKLQVAVRRSTTAILNAGLQPDTTRQTSLVNAGHKLPPDHGYV